ncbi:MAG TPA: OmpA family protein [Methylomirabilota bacterium]|jgi:outer membrane protein OmpA-like peptidoglycan-associated protein|nr:OmpA family protein [Methylomirabilota bacterium]
MRRIVMWSAALAFAMIATTGCATKDWVNDKLGKKQAQMDQRFGQVDGSLKEVGDATRVAQGRADAAYGRADEVNTRLTRLWNGRNKRDVVETLHVQFGFDKSDLSDGAQTALLGVIKELKANPDLSVDLEGFTDPTGTKDYNVGLSQRRVEAVRRFLITNGAGLARVHSVGLGPLTASAGEHPKLRRVTLRLMVNPTD